jgi:hypothetical protein
MGAMSVAECRQTPDSQPSENENKLLASALHRSEIRAEITMRNTATKTTSKPVALLVVERGSDFGGWLDGFQARAEAVRLVAQRDEEAASAFAARVRAEVRALDADISDAVLVGAMACDPEVLGARALMVRAMTSRMAPEGRLLLDGSGRTRLAMEALAQICSDQLVGVRVVTEVPIAAPLAA